MGNGDYLNFSTTSPYPIHHNPKMTTQRVLKNPILPGFHPDPMICRKGDDFYIANSSFQWWPGVPIHHSKDLKNWELIGYALTRTSQLDMNRLLDSQGVWAPSLTYCPHDDLFYLVYTNVNRHSRYSTLETPNYVVTAKDPRGPWSEPVYLNCSGFDPSFFHDDDGRTWMVNMVWSHHPEQRVFDGILLQEYSRAEKRLVGERVNIFPGTPLGATEGPHLFKRNGWYYLLVAEGGTGYGHAMMMARARNVTGPYEPHPENPIMTARQTDGPIQKAGHGNLVDTPTGEWYGVFLCGRPRNGRFCVLGRETAIERGSWDDDWFRFDSRHPRAEVPAPRLPEHPKPEIAHRDDFDAETLKLHWNTLRMPAGDEVSLTERPDWLRLHAQQRPLETNERQAFVAQRLRHRDFEATTLMEFAPKNDWQYAGLTCFYGHANYLWLRVTRHRERGVIVALVRRHGDKLTLQGSISAEGWKQFYLRVQADNDQYQFAASPDGENWENVGAPEDGAFLSDEAAAEFGAAFTGTFVGVAAVDISGDGAVADFDWFDYRGRDAWRVPM